MEAKGSPASEPAARDAGDPVGKMELVRANK